MKKLVLALAIILVLPLSVRALESDTDEIFHIVATANGVRYSAPYDRHLTQYDSRLGWISGDRVGYTCAWTFLEYDGEKVAQVGFVRLPEADYVVVNDKHMYEAGEGLDVVYDWGGTVRPPRPRKTVPKSEVCPSVLESYRLADGPIGPLPRIVFSDAVDGHTLEVRNYANSVLNQTGKGPRWKFQIVQASDDRVTVIGYQNGTPELAVYYETLSPAVDLTSNGVG